VSHVLEPIPKSSYPYAYPLEHGQSTTIVLVGFSGSIRGQVSRSHSFPRTVTSSTSSLPTTSIRPQFSQSAFGILDTILTLQLPESALSTREVSECARRLPQDVKDNFAAFVLALLKFVRLPEREDLEGVYAKFTALVSAYTYVDLYQMHRIS